MSQLVDSALEGATLLGVYEVTEKIGKGGMAWVYKGTHKRLGGHLAMKILASLVAAEPDARERFLREARLQHSLQHEHIVRVMDVIEEDGICGIVMEWCDGGDLHEWFGRRGRALEPAHVKTFFLPLLDALGLAHSKGIIHRDIKPRNVLLASTPSGLSPKLTDFGIAKALGEESHTATGATMGTLRYIAPEQLNDSKHVDLRADIYSFGAMLYFLLTGRPPFRGSGPAIIHQIMQQPPPPPIEAAQPFHRVLLKCLAKHPDDRYATCQALSFALNDALDEMNSGSGAIFSAPDMTAFEPAPSPGSISESQPFVRARAPLPTGTNEAQGPKTTPMMAMQIPPPDSSGLVIASDNNAPKTTPMAVPGFVASHPQTASTDAQIKRWKMLAGGLLLLLLCGGGVLVGLMMGRGAGVQPRSRVLSKRVEPPVRRADRVQPVPVLRREKSRTPPMIARPTPRRRVQPVIRRKVAKRTPSVRKVRRLARARRKRSLQRRKRSLLRRTRPRRPRRRYRLVRIKRKHHKMTIMAEPWDLYRGLSRAARISSLGRKDAMRVKRELCKRKFGRACTSIGFGYRKPKPEKAVPWIKKGCDYGSAWSCVHYGFMFSGYWARTGHMRNIEKACSAFQRACDGRASWGCQQYNKNNCGGDAKAPYPSYMADMTHRILAKHKKPQRFRVSTMVVAGWMRYRKTMGGKKLIPAILARACELDEGFACLQLAELYDKTPKTYPKAYRLGLRACRLGWAGGCKFIMNFESGYYKPYNSFKNKEKACIHAKEYCRLKKLSYCHSVKWLKCK